MTDHLALRARDTAEGGVAPPTSQPESFMSVEADVEAILAGFQLQKLKRYFHQRFWELESREAEYADRIEGALRLENVAAHSWHVADAAMLLSSSFSDLNAPRCVQLAILHDKLEMFTGDFNPVGRDGKGVSTHAFNVEKQLEKRQRELAAAERYLSMLSLPTRSIQRALIEEIIAGKTAESKFIKAVDKLQALAYVHVKKNGAVTDTHLKFTLQYSRKAVTAFPRIIAHYQCLRSKFLERIAKKRGIDYRALELSLFSQAEFDI